MEPAKISDAYSEDYTSLPSGNEWILAVTNRNRTKQPKRSSNTKDSMLKKSGFRVISESREANISPECELAELKQQQNK